MSSMTTRPLRSAGLLAAGALRLAIAASTPARAHTVTDWSVHATNDYVDVP